MSYFLIAMMMFAKAQAHPWPKPVVQCWQSFTSNLIMDDPYQFEHHDSDELFNWYHRRAIECMWLGKRDRSLAIASRQLRWNHENLAPLRAEQLRILASYRQFEGK